MKLEPADKEVKSLLTKLLTNYRLFFSKDGVLNSEGRKLFENIARTIIREHPERKEMISRVRKKPTIDNIIKVATIYVSEDEVYELLNSNYG